MNRWTHPTLTHREGATHQLGPTLNRPLHVTERLLDRHAGRLVYPARTMATLAVNEKENPQLERD